MSIKACIYKDCENYINTKDRRNDDVKLFSFPKNPERFQKWIELGRVPLNLPSSMYYFCSNHFDKKYFAVNNRRTILVGEAVPIPYVEPENVESNVDDDINYYLYEENRSNAINEKTDISDDQNILVESTTVTTELQDEHVLVEEYSGSLYEELVSEGIVYSDSEKNNLEYCVTYDNKRKLNSSTIEDSPFKTKIFKITPQNKQQLRTSHEKSQEITPSASANTKIPDNLIQESKNSNFGDADELVDEKHVTTFIFKGEEYVQMSKEYYINDKISIMKKMREMERVLKAIKGHINSLED